MYDSDNDDCTNDYRNDDINYDNDISSNYVKLIIIIAIMMIIVIPYFHHCQYIINIMFFVDPYFIFYILLYNTFLLSFSVKSAFIIN